MSLTKHAAFLVAFLVLNGHAQAQFKGMAERMPAMPAASMAVPAPVTAPDLGPTTAASIWVTADLGVLYALVARKLLVVAVAGVLLLLLAGGSIQKWCQKAQGT